MAKWKDGVERGIYEVAARWRDECLLADGGLWSPAGTWSVESVTALDDLFNGNELRGDGDFGDKFDAQIDDAPSEVRRLAAEMLAVHFLFTQSVTQEGKLKVINRVLAPLGETLGPASPMGELMAYGIGGPGAGFNMRRDLQFGYIVDFCLRLKKLDVDAARRTLADPTATKEFADQTQRRWKREMRHILLHLLHPDHFERMSSGTHKRLIAEAFAEFLPVDTSDLDDEDRVLRIRRALEERNIAGSWPAGYMDFYSWPLEGIWRLGASEEEDEDADNEGVSLIEALEWRKQAILYGPPGTSKTYRIHDVIGLLIRRAALREWGAMTYFDSPEHVEQLVRDRVEWLQLHPAYSYEDFVRGMRIRDGNTVYEAGVLLNRITKLTEEAREDPTLTDIPWVIVLDEINRTDLSRLLGEAFSLLEPDMRGKTVSLPGLEGGAAENIAIPSNLVVIGTMNLIDQSVEQIDFALRRRFHWHPCRFNPQLLLHIIYKRLEEFGTAQKHLRRPQLRDQLEHFSNRAVAVNEQIAAIDELGEEYELGHTIFADIARPLHQTIRRYANVRSYYLWDTAGAMTPIEDLWRFQMRPLLDQYLGSLPAGDRRETIGNVYALLTAKP
ncbi:MAG: AAA family ATPase [Solirubrobacteraceae bacterium]